MNYEWLLLDNGLTCIVNLVLSLSNLILQLGNRSGVEHVQGSKSLCNGLDVGIVL